MLSYVNIANSEPKHKGAAWAWQHRVGFWAQLSAAATEPDQDVRAGARRSSEIQVLMSNTPTKPIRM